MNWRKRGRGCARGKGRGSREEGKFNGKDRRKERGKGTGKERGIERGSWNERGREGSGSFSWIFLMVRTMTNRLMRREGRKGDSRRGKKGEETIGFYTSRYTLGKKRERDRKQNTKEIDNN